MKCIKKGCDGAVEIYPNGDAVCNKCGTWFSLVLVEQTVEVKLNTVIELLISTHKGLAVDVKENRSGPAFRYLVEEAIRTTHGTVKPCFIVLELRKQLGVTEPLEG